MPEIHALPEEVVRCIAAGEVVERPASVVKELVENAVDAGAKRITLRCSGAGSKLVEVIDNGSGMSPEDIAMAHQNFSTSKITTADDLFRISTYGFRGEALASIAAVSTIEIISSSRSGGEGWAAAVEGMSTVRSSPAPHEKGTTVRVQNLFYNTPARKKFLKSDLSERKKILETFLSFVLVIPEIEFHYLDDGEHVVDLLPAASWRERVAAVLGASTMKHMVAVQSKSGPLRIGGFASLPTYTRSNRANQFVYVNRRFVREKTISHAITDAYRNVIPAKRFPVLVLAVDIPFEEVDVNVHPRKLEVRIKNERYAHEAVRSALKSALSAKSESEMIVSFPGQDFSGEGAGRSASERAKRSVRPQPPTAEDEHARYGDLKVITLKERIKDAYTDYMVRRGQMDFNPQLSLRVEDVTRKEPGEADDWKERFLGEESLFWQFNNAYIFIQVRGGVVIIDQHAAHERVIFDTCKRNLEREVQVSQQILFPIHLELSLGELEIFRSSKDIFAKIGFDLEPFGGKSILVRGYPQGLKNWDEGKLLLQIFDDLLHDKAPGNDHTEKVLASFACRSAVKAGKKLTVDEMRLLADQLFASENPYSCPHGRPTIQRISLEEIERWFQRR
ncbi:MAG: DNA mismatch repair endonuclease MutL [Candidatus Latescibacteria bacterium]|nr:DNA mismatch repair endonuclease MutL [Candidatus Latescibacterota bacterium]NIM21324.1 DNA mismatch repair endonuclease MutL [Candidatus Latescibacterota bacterium]NIM65505.1 DNA mismatch repair endonuclease MutL [Candidatus Latescibacterota bacterium]NIO01885.1 DNA mismatch repair endonuclease MutL [Candidatus Latescibacterota bacterium]NIO28698.1 DNA mismatch repair endonuclease MutL [Candidatus Latescibacterota bacterium]